MKPLFIPLKREYFEAFKAGTKLEEFRPYGRRWNERTCVVGRPVVISLGYGRAHRMVGVVSAFRQSMEPTTSAAWAACYGAKHAGAPAACIAIALEPTR
jgi:hypothetical protein